MRQNKDVKIKLSIIGVFMAKKADKKRKPRKPTDSDNFKPMKLDGKGQRLLDPYKPKQ
jgi:hypothetical protein